MKKSFPSDSRTFTVILVLTMLIIGLAPASAVERRPATGQEAGQRHRIVPVYAFHKDGTPVIGLTSGDLVISVNGSRVDGFTLANGETSRRTIFLVFDSASTSYNLLTKSKKIAETVIMRLAGQSRFVVMAIDPYFGLQTIFGPTENRQVALKAMARLLSAKKTDYLQSKAAEGTKIRDAYPSERDSSRLAPEEQQGRTDSDRRKDRQLSTTITNALTTLNAVLVLFPDSSKIVHLYSCGIPTSATEDYTEMRYQNDEIVNLTSPDSWSYDRVRTIGQSFKKTGAILFVINPAGTRVGEESPDSGEHSLHMIVEESGGRYFEGSDKDIARALEATEQGYYEVSLPLPQELEGTEMAVDIRPKDSKIDIFSATSLARSRRFLEMTPQEREALILSLLAGGLVGDIDLKISPLQVEAVQAGESAFLIAQLPVELSQHEWDIYKVLRDPDKGLVEVEKEHTRSEGTRLEFAMTIREGFLQDAVLVQARTGTVLICQTKAEAKE